MKNNYIKKLYLVVMIISLSISLVGCIEYETVPVELSLPKIDSVTGNVLQLEHEIEGGIKFITTYDVGDYKFENWRITDSKTIKMTARVENVPDGAEIFIDHVHVDMALKSTSPQLDSLIQDSMDDKYHGFSQDGFFISEKYPYENIFAVEGFSKDIIEGWIFYNGSYGHGSMSSQRLTEENLIRNGTYANKLSVVYDILIKHEGEKYYHTKSISDELLIAIPQTTIDKINNQ